MKCRAVLGAEHNIPIGSGGGGLAEVTLAHCLGKAFRCLPPLYMSGLEHGRPFLPTQHTRHAYTSKEVVQHDGPSGAIIEYLLSIWDVSIDFASLGLQQQKEVLKLDVHDSPSRQVH